VIKFSKDRENRTIENIEPEKLGVAKLLGLLKPKQFWGVITTITVILTAVAVFSYKVGVNGGIKF